MTPSLIGKKAWLRNVFRARHFSSNDGDDDPKPPRFHAGLHLRPHPNKRHKGGEDAAALNDRLLCLADGVGGWAESGVDPAIYSRRLCSL